MIQFLNVPNQKHDKSWRKMSKKNIIKVHSSTISILNSPRLIRGSTSIPPDLRIERQMKPKRVQRLLNLSITEMVGSRPHLYGDILNAFFETNVGRRAYIKKENLL